jgi:hypothetical protein
LGEAGDNCNLVADVHVFETHQNRSSIIEDRRK